METWTAQSLTPSALEALIADARVHLEGLGYRAATLSIYRGIWKSLARFSSSTEKAETLRELCSCFLSAHDTPVGDVAVELSSRKRQFRTAVRVLVEFAENGCVHHRRRHRTNKTLLCSAFRQVLQDYLSFSRDYLGHAPRTLRLRKYDLTEFLGFLESQGNRSLSTISGNRVVEFVSSRDHLATATLQHYTSALRSFLRYLCAHELIDKDVSTHVPTIPHYRFDRVPSVWTQGEVEALLGAVDRRSAQGKRDYAILLLACRFGMRVGDIRELRLEHLLWNEARIEIAQAKTGEPLSLPMSEEVGWALIDYLRHGRPASEHRYVFLRLMAPFDPFGADNNLHHLVNQYRRRAGIALTDQCRRGMHSLRHTLASRLLQQQTPIETIADILGHRSTESTLVYTKVDITALRTAALDPLQEVCDA